MYKKITQIAIVAILSCLSVTAQTVSELKTQLENVSALINHWC